MFKSAAQEAAWWDKHPEVALGILEAAKRDGTLTGGEVLRKLERRRTLLTTIRLFTDDVSRAKAIGHRKGLGYQTYIKMLIREGLEREEPAQ